MRFYDTSSLLLMQDKAFESPFVISSLTVQELEHIKISKNRTEDVRFSARNLVRLLKTHDDYKVVVYTMELDNVLKEKNLPITNDNLIAATAYIENKNTEIEFFTDDLILSLVAESVFNLNVQKAEVDKSDLYKGYLEVTLDDEQMALLYENLNENTYGLLTNEYLLIRNSDGDVVDKRKWDGESLIPIKFKSFKSKTFGEIKALDEIQQCAFDSMINNDITVMYGKAGSGKTTLPLAYIMNGLESQKFRKCYIVYHYETLRGAKTLGYEKGSHEEKILNSGSLGNVLASKFVDYKYITSLLGDKIEIIPTANIRGVEFSDEDVVFVTEAQDIDVYTMKTIIQRCKAGCKQIYEGDIIEQTDKDMSMSGVSRMIEVFKGYHNFGCVKLHSNYRSEICSMADLM